MTYRRKSTPADDAMLDDDSADWGQRASAITRVGVDQLQHLEPQVARLLEHEFDEIRAAAIATLVMHWKMPRYVPRALDMLRADEDSGPRSSAALSLSHFTDATGQQREDILRALALAVVTDGSRWVARQAYTGILFVLREDAKYAKVPLVDFDKDRDTDWAILRPYLPS